VKDFHYNKLLNAVPEPLIIKLNPASNKYLFAKINPGINDVSHIAKIKQYIQNTCNNFSPEHPMQSQFLTDYSFKEERSTETMKEIVLFSTILAILISCLGLFGLSILIIQQRTKEIGIRKTLGATIPNVTFMITKEFIKWVLLANIIAWPVAYYFMNKWLEDFAYRIEITWWIFALSGGIALVIALATVSIQAIKAATANPVESLKCE
jgi:putative ABC transport system permease protein